MDAPNLSMLWKSEQVSSCLPQQQPTKSMSVKYIMWSCSSRNWSIVRCHGSINKVVLCRILNVFFYFPLWHVVTHIWLIPLVDDQSPEWVHHKIPQKTKKKHQLYVCILEHPEPTNITASSTWPSFSFPLSSFFFFFVFFMGERNSWERENGRPNVGGEEDSSHMDIYLIITNTIHMVIL